MTEHRVTLPVRLDSSWARPLIKCANAIASHDDVEIDAGAVTFAYPFGVVTLGAALLRRERRGLRRPSYEAPREANARQFLAEVGFEELVRNGHTQSRGTLALRRVSSTALDPQYTNEVARLIATNVPRTSESVSYLVETAMNEMLQNAIEHAESTTEAVVLARWYAHDTNIRIAIADSGIGFAESLRRNPRYAGVSSDASLVRKAITEEGTTGRVSGRFGGLGLKNLYQVCLQREGSVHVSSRLVDASYKVGKQSEQYVPELEGTTVEIDFRPGPGTGTRPEPESEDFF